MTTPKEREDTVSGDARAVCRYCACSYEAPAWQFAKSDFSCKPCARIKQAEWRARRKADGRPVESMRMPREYHAQYRAVYFQDPEARARRAAQMRAYAKKPGIAEHHKARIQTNHAIKAGRLVRQPCEVCGADDKVHAHHDDYSKPLDVRWLCPEHHREHHAKATGASQ